MAYLQDAKADGLVRQIGVTGHSRPDAHMRALQHFDAGWRFDAMQLPINPIDFHQQSFQREVLPALVERGIGVIAMKTSADGALLQRRVCTIDECQRYVWSLPVSTAVVGMQTPDQIRDNARRAREAATMATDEMEFAPRSDCAPPGPRAGVVQGLRTEWVSRTDGVPRPRRDRRHGAEEKPRARAGRRHRRGG